jgi:hypothetical protein
MVMTLEDVEDIAEHVLREGVTSAARQRLRWRFDGIHLTFCLDDEVTGAEPVVRKPGLNVYLADARGHCIRLTNDLAAATGLVLAEVFGDED